MQRRRASNFPLDFFCGRWMLPMLGNMFCLNVAATAVPRYQANAAEAEVQMNAIWSVMIVFEEGQTRENAVKFCNQLVERFWAQCEFKMTWLPFDALSDPNAARDAYGKARGADMIVFATLPEGPVPAPVSDWVEKCLANRTDREGTLAGLIDCGPVTGGPAAEKHAWLRKVAHRAGMDYLTEVPQNIDRPIPDSLDTYSERAQQVTSVLDEILHRPVPPPSLY